MHSRTTRITATIFGLSAFMSGALTACFFDSTGALIAPPDAGPVPGDATVPADATVPGDIDAGPTPLRISWRKQLTIAADQVAGEAKGFPVLVRVTDNELAARAHPDGLDIYFRSDTGAVLPFERVRYDGATGDLLAWVLMDLSGDEQAFYLHYGDGNTRELSDPADTWTNEYINVWHLEAAAGPRIDATGNDDATEIGDPAGAPGIVGSGAHFDGDDALSFQNRISGNGPHTVSMWLSETGTGDQLVFGTGDWNPQRLRYLRIASNDRIQHGFHSNDTDTPTGVPAGWHHIAWVFQGAPTYDSQMYLDGALLSSHTFDNSVNTTGRNGRLGIRWANNNQWLEGDLDEVRYAGAARSPEWVLTAYNNQRPGSTFVAVTGAEEEVVAVPRRKRLTVAGAEVPSPLDRFPVLVRLTDIELGAAAHPSGHDIYFTDQGGAPLPFERTNYDGATGELLAWVKMDLTGGDQDFYLYYGDGELGDEATPAQVWDNEFAGVWHLNRSADGMYHDSTGAGNDATEAKGVNPAAGQIGDAVEIDPGDTSGIVVGDVAVVDDITISVWVDADSFSDWRNIVVKRNFADHRTEYALDAEDSSNGDVRFYYRPDGNWYIWEAERPVLETDAGWQYLTVTHRVGEAPNFYLDGSVAAVGVQTEGSGSPARVAYPDIATVLGGGVSVPGNWNWDGRLDEVRISATVRSEDWIATEYNNQRANSAFLSAGAEEEL